ncbi:MAG: cadherin domain-containing protein, partial [Planctomycetaceae bacterium]
TLDFETKASYAVTVNVADTSLSGSTPVTVNYALTVTNVNEAPSDITLSTTSVAENSPVGAILGSFTPSDPDAGDAFTYALVSGSGDTDNAAFTIVGRDLQIASKLNFEAKQTYFVRVRVTDAGGLAMEKALSITVTDIADEPLLVERITPPASGAYGAARRVQFTVSLSEVVQVTGKPEIEVRAGTATRKATYVSGSGTAVLTFEYTVNAKDSAAAVAIGQKFLFPKKSGVAAGTEKLAAALPAGIAGATAPGVRFDAVAPRTSGKVTVPGAGTYTVGRTLDFVVRFSEAVIVGGTPQISLTGFSGARQATYVSGSGTTELTFRYLVQTGDAVRGKKGLGLAKSIALAGGASITDEAGNRADLKIVASPMKGIRIDAVTATSTLAREDVTPSKRTARAAAFASL